MRTGGTGLELGMELAAKEPRMLRQLDDLHEPAVRRDTRQAEAELGEHIAERVADLPAVPMSLADFGGAVRLRRPASGAEPGGVCTEPHGTPQIHDVTL